MSMHPHTPTATGEAIGQVLEAIGDGPDLAVVFFTRDHAEAAARIARAIRATLRPSVLLGCAAESVAANGTEVEAGAAISLWAGRVGTVRPVRIHAGNTAEGADVIGWDNAASPGATLLLVADPFTFPTAKFLAQAVSGSSARQVVGGLASAANGAGGNRLILDGDVFWHGAVGVLLDPSCDITPVVSQGCEPVGRPFVVTAASGNAILGLGSQPAVQRLDELLLELGSESRDRFVRGPQIGVVVDEHKTEFSRGDFLIRPVLGADRGTGAVIIGDQPDIGTTMQFHIRDADSAHEELARVIATTAGERVVAGTLLFTCNSRGRRLFDEPNHDAGLIHELTTAPLGGMFCAGEIGPLGTRSYLHSFAASALLFH